MPIQAGEREVQLDSPAGPLDAIWRRPADPFIQMVLAHGAGAGIRHHNMQSIAEAFADVGVATLRFNFPYMQAGRKRVDRKDIAIDAINTAVQYAQMNNALPLWLGGHSFGGRMASHAVAEGAVEPVGLVFCSFPLHQPKKPGLERAAHLDVIDKPMLFLSGTRDDLARVELLEEVVARQSSDASIRWLETANHSYVPLKRTRENPLTVFEEMAQGLAEFLRAHA